MPFDADGRTYIPIQIKKPICFCLVIVVFYLRMQTQSLISNGKYNSCASGIQLDSPLGSISKDSSQFKHEVAIGTNDSAVASNARCRWFESSNFSAMVQTKIKNITIQKSLICVGIRLRHFANWCQLEAEICCEKKFQEIDF